MQSSENKWLKNLWKAIFNMTEEEQKQHEAYHNDVIYFVTCMKPTIQDGEYITSRKRCWGWYHKYEDAVIAVLENHVDINEHGYYPIAIIERMPQGVVPIPKCDGSEETWFKWNGGYKQIEKPKWSDRIIHWCF